MDILRLTEQHKWTELVAAAAKANQDPVNATIFFTLSATRGMPLAQWMSLFRLVPLTTVQKICVVAKILHKADLAYVGALLARLRPVDAKTVLMFVHEDCFLPASPQKLAFVEAWAKRVMPRAKL